MRWSEILAIICRSVNCLPTGMSFLIIRLGGLGDRKKTHTHRKCVRTMQSAGNNFLFTCVFPVWCHQQLLAALSVWRFGVKLCQPACLPASWRVNCEQIVMGRSSYCFANTNKNGMKRFEATNLHGEVYYFPWKKEMSRKLLCGCSTCER